MAMAKSRWCRASYCWPCWLVVTWKCSRSTRLQEEWVAAVKSNEEVQRFVVPELFLRAFMSEVRQAYTPL